MQTSATARTAGSPIVVSVPGSGRPSAAAGRAPGQRGEAGRDEHGDRRADAGEPPPTSAPAEWTATVRRARRSPAPWPQARPCPAGSTAGSRPSGRLAALSRADRVFRWPRPSSGRCERAPLRDCRTWTHPAHPPTTRRTAAAHRHRPAGVGPLAWAASPLANAARVLDVGCGSGPLADEFRRAMGRRRPGAGPGAATGRRRGRPTPCRCATTPSTASVLLLALPRLPDLDGVFAELRRVLRPGGTLVVVVPSATVRSPAELRLAPLLAAVHRGGWTQPLRARPGRVAARRGRLRGARRRPRRRSPSRCPTRQPRARSCRDLSAGRAVAA